MQVSCAHETNQVPVAQGRGAHEGSKMANVVEWHNGHTRVPDPRARVKAPGAHRAKEAQVSLTWTAIQLNSSRVQLHGTRHETSVSRDHAMFFISNSKP